MSKVTSTAPGKLMVFGEHAVVYGYPCIVTSINKYITVEVEKTKLESDIFHTPGVPDTSFIRNALNLFREKYNTEDPVSITTQSDLGNYGLGSSAAVTVALVKALAKLYDIRLSKKELFKLSYETILGVQKTASGFDVAASVFGGTILFDGKSKKVKKITSEKLPLLAVYSGKKASTVSMIDRVKRLRDRKPRFVEEIFLEIARIVNEAKQAIENCDWKRVGKLMSQNHELLVRLGVSTKKLDDLVMRLGKAGALGTKLSGAGGGDCVIVIVPKEINNTGFKIIDI